MFDPPTDGHLSVIRSLIAVEPKDIWLMPSAKRADKLPFASNDLRMEMVNRFLAHFGLTDSISISGIELESNVPSVTYETNQKLQSIYPERKFRWLIGTDVAASMHTWGSAQQAINQVPWLIHERPGFESMNQPTDAYALPSRQKPVETSSTMVRDWVSSDKTINKFVCSPVVSVIEDNNLYQYSQSRTNHH